MDPFRNCRYGEKGSPLLDFSYFNRLQTHCQEFFLAFFLFSEGFPEQCSRISRTVSPSVPAKNPASFAENGKSPDPRHFSPANKGVQETNLSAVSPTGAKMCSPAIVRALSVSPPREIPQQAQRRAPRRCVPVRRMSPAGAKACSPAIVRALSISPPQGISPPGQKPIRR